MSATQRQQIKWRKWLRRGQLVATNSLNSLLPMLFTPLLSLLIIRRSSDALWGAFVGVLIVVQLGAHVVAWGNGPYLLRAFSRNPSQIGSAWQSSLLTRLLLAAALAVILLFFYPAAQARWMILWGAALILHQSCAVLITYRRDFLFSALVELAGLGALLTAVLIQKDDLTVDLLIRAFGLSVAGKAILLLWRHRLVTGGRGEPGKQGRSRFQPQYFALAFPFFLLGFSGMLNSRIDLYAVNYFFTEQDVGQYQVFTTFLLHLQALAGFVLVPFVKSIYRLQHATIRKMALGLLGVGLLVIPPALFALNWLLRELYSIELPPRFFLLGGLMTLPIYFNLPIIYAVYKADKQIIVLWVNIGSALLNLALNFLFLPRWGLIGAVASTTIVSWLALLVYALQSASLNQKEVVV